MGFMAALLMIVLAAFLLRSEWEKLQLEPVAYIVETEKKPGFPGPAPEEGKLRLLFISDLHDWPPARLHPELLLSAVEEVAPDAVLIGGDMITVPKKGRKTVRETKTVLSLIGRLAENYPVCYGEGNHERRLRERDPEAYAEYVKQLLALGVQVLADHSVPLRVRKEPAGAGVKAAEPEEADVSDAEPEENRKTAPGEVRRACGGKAGRETGTMVFSASLEPEYYRRSPGFGPDPDASLPEGYLEQKIGTPDPQRFNILLLHSPVYLKEAAAWGADLVLSGHMHGGTVRLPGGRGLVTPQYRFFVKECSGSFRSGKTLMIVNRGLGTHSVKLRFHDLPELSVIDIVPRKAE